MIEQAAILVGGLGSRLGPLTRATPKPMLEVGGRPFLDYLIENLRRHGLRRILLLCGYQAGVVAAHYRDDPDIEIVVEQAPLGTGGALRNAKDRLDPRYFLLNGDSFFDVNVLALVPGAGEIATIALRGYAGSDRAGWVEWEGGAVKAFHTTGAQPSCAINTGVYLLSRNVLDWIPEGVSSLEADVLTKLAGAGKLGARTLDGYFIDIGVPDDFARAQTEVPARRRRPAIFFDRDGVLNHDDNYVHRPDQVRWIDGAIEAVRLVNDAGWYAFVVTNQAGVAHGLYDEGAVNNLHAWMSEALQTHGAHIDGFEYAPSHPEGKIAAYRRQDSRRKPGPGMLLDLMKAFPVDAQASWLIGDRESDLAAAAAAGVSGELFTGGRLDALVAQLLGRRG